MPKNAAPLLHVEPTGEAVLETVRELEPHQREIVARAVQETTATRQALTAAKESAWRAEQHLRSLLALLEPDMGRPDSGLSFDFATMRFQRTPGS